MTRKARSKVDPIEQEIELTLNPGAFIPDRACYSFVSDLDKVAAKIAKLIASDPSRAVALYETFLAACYLKIEELDDSSGSFGQLVDELYCGWIKARQAEGASPDETVARLLAWMDDDEYGFCYQLEKDAAKVLDKANLAAFVTQIRARFDAAALSNFESAKRCFERAGLHAEWQKTISQVRADHHRKSGFMSGFEHLVEGTGPSDEPSFMEQAKVRWGERHRRAR
jgi:hypothetical protein